MQAAGALGLPLRRIPPNRAGAFAALTADEEVLPQKRPRP
jgi:hypothetical protein